MSPRKQPHRNNSRQVENPLQLSHDSENQSAVAFARLLRTDKYRSAKNPPGWPTDEFDRAWWLLSGRVELSRGSPITERDMEWLLESVEGWPCFDDLTLNRAMWFIWHNRPLFQQKFPLKGPRDLLGLICWFWSDGLRELQLAADLPDSWKNRLNTPASNFFWGHTATADERPPLLMALTLMARQELSTVFDLKTPEGIKRAWLWFFTAGANRMGITPVLTDHWKTWCNALTPTGPCGLDVPRLASIKWQCDPHLRERFPLLLFPHQAGLLQWYAETIETHSDWKWLGLSATQQSEAWKRRFGTYTTYPRPKKRFGVNLIGFAKGELGIGEDLRTAAKVLEIANIPFSVVNIHPGANVRQADESLAHKLSDDAVGTAPYPISIFCLTAFDTARVYVQKGPSLFAGRYNIGWWPWELAVWPKRWSRVFDLVDEIWGASQFNVTMYRSATAKPVHHIPLNFQVQRANTYTREAFGLSANAFTFLYVFDGNSYPRRKNPLAVIHAFQQAFPPGDSRVALVLKTMNGKTSTAEWQIFMAACKSDDRIMVIEKTLDKVDVNGLIDCCDAYVSLHRSEGFGRTLAEALLLGKPVIASDWSGTTDFLTEKTGYPVRGKLIDVNVGDYPFVAQDDSAQWFDADTQNAASQMRAVYETAQHSPRTLELKALSGQQILMRAPVFLLERLKTLREELES